MCAEQLTQVLQGRPHAAVLDFGCGGGYLLHNLTCAEKAGIEVNPAAIEDARAKGLTIYPKRK